MLASLKIQTSTALGFGDLRTRDVPDRNRVPRHLASPIDFSVGTEPKPVNFEFFHSFSSLGTGSTREKTGPIIAVDILESTCG